MASLLGIALWLWLFSAHAEQHLRTRVAIVADNAAPAVQREIRTRLRAELSASGFEVVEARNVGEPRESVEAALEECDAVAAIAIASRPEDDSVDVWVSDSVTGATLVRSFDGDGCPTRCQDASILALETVEFVRANVTDIDWPSLGAERPPPLTGGKPWLRPPCPELEPSCGSNGLRSKPAAARTPETQPPTPDAAEPLEEEERRGHPIELALSGAVAWVRELGAEGGPLFAIGHLTAVGIDVRATLVGPLYGAGIQGAAGSATVRELRLHASVGYRAPVVPGRFDLEPYLAAGAHNVHADGSADPPYEGVSAQAWAFALDAGLRALLWLDSPIGVELGLHGAITMPPADLKIAGESVALVDLPVLYASAGVVLAPWSSSRGCLVTCLAGPSAASAQIPMQAPPERRSSTNRRPIARRLRPGRASRGRWL